MHAVARLRLAKHEFDETRERYINRAEFVVQAGVGLVDSDATGRGRDD